MIGYTIEKDVDLRTDRDKTLTVERASATGSDDKSKTFDNKVDVGEAEAVAAGLEQGYQVAKISEALGIDHRIAYAAVLESLASLARAEAAK